MARVNCFKEYPAQKRGDVTACGMCPPDVTTEIQEHLIKLSLERESKHKRKREMLEDMRRRKIQSHLPPECQGEVAGEIDAEEKALLDQAIKESLHTHEMEERKVKAEAEDFAKACLESVHSYELELKRHEEGSSSHYNYEIFDETDYDSDLSF